MALSFAINPQDYDATRPSYPQSFTKHIKGLLNNGSEILDVGSGTGKACEKLAHSSCTINALDPSMELLTILESKNLENTSCICGTFEESELPANAYDVILFGQSFHWINDRIVYNKSKRILKDKGYLCLLWYNFCSELPSIMHRIRTILEKHCSLFHDDPFNNFVDLRNHDKKIREQFQVNNLALKQKMALTVNSQYERENLITLISTFSYVKMLPQKQQQELFKTLRQELPKNTVTIPQEYVMYIVQKESAPISDV